jgi:threonylcarbamoyladenosine tRNA methylthiotransferase MtaB
MTSSFQTPSLQTFVSKTIEVNPLKPMPRIVTFGCRLNSYESEVIKDLSMQAGLENSIVVNTCGVTLEAERQAQQAIRRLRRDYPDAEIIVTGCAAQMNSAKYAGMKEVSRVVGNEEKMKLSTYLDSQNQERIIVNDIMSIRETAGHLVAGFEGKARAFVQIQNGCDHRCTYCAIPFGRGNSRSVAMGEIVAQTRKLLEAGYREIVMTGVDITAYGLDLPGTPSLGQMIRSLLALVPDLKRLRLSSIDPVEIDEDLWQLIETESRLMPHLHVSLQSGDDMILKRMKRRHLRADAILFCQKVRRVRPEAVFGADLIAGFPTETEDMFKNTLDIIDECGLTYLHIFPYSPRPDTPASRMPQLPASIIKERASLLRQKGEQVLQQFYKSCVNQKTQVLIESSTQTFAGGQTLTIIQGKTDQFAPLSFSTFLDNPGTGAIVSTRVIDFNCKGLVGELVS